MPKLTFNDVSKKFGNDTVVDRFSADVPDNEFLVLLGPSGCGKSTMLRMIAGLIDITAGELQFDGVRVNEMEPKQRNVAVVFQSYALYPHMTVRANIAFPLIMDHFRFWHHIPVISSINRRRLLRDPEISRQVETIANTMGLGDLMERRPASLSGGQRQRVAVARALVREPALYLLDEPLSNLDAKLRTQMRAEIISLYQRVQKTFVYVTHDQVEAMTMGTRIAVLESGVVRQYGTPREIYETPANRFVAQFIGSPPMNLIEVAIEKDAVRLPGGNVLTLPRAFPGSISSVLLGVRAENIHLESVKSTRGIPSRVIRVEHLGAETIVGVRFLVSDASGRLDEDAPSDVVYARIPGDVRFSMGDQCKTVLGLENASFFTSDSGDRVEFDDLDRMAESGRISVPKGAHC